MGSTKGNFENAIVVAGNTGVGKSYFCNKLFQYCGSTSSFISSDSNHSVTQALQSGNINYNGINYTLIDSPGFFDTHNTISSNDGSNVCKLVNALENCKQIISIVFVYTDRLSSPHLMWFERIKTLLSEAYKGHIVLVHNKLGELNPDIQAKNKTDVRVILNSNQEYVWFSFYPGQDQVELALKTIVKFSPFQLNGLQIPEICYEKCVDDLPYDEEISRNLRDEGHMETQVKDTSHYETRHKWAGGLGKVLGQKKAYKVWVPSSVQEQVWIKKDVTRRTVVTYINSYKVRFDGTRDLKEKKEISRREEIV